MSAGVVFKRIGGYMTKQLKPGIILQIEKRPDAVRRLLISTPTKDFAEFFTPYKTELEAYDLQWISICRGISEAIQMGQRTIHIQMTDQNIVNSMCTNQYPTDNINTKYYHLIITGSIAKTEWTDIRAIEPQY